MKSFLIPPLSRLSCCLGFAQAAAEPSAARDLIEPVRLSTIKLGGFWKQQTKRLAALVLCGFVWPAATAADVPAVAQASPVKLPEKGKFLLFLLAGQSNMAGRGVTEPEDQVANPRVLTLTKDGKWVAAVDPIHFDKPGSGVGPDRAAVDRQEPDRGANLRRSRSPIVLNLTHRQRSAPSRFRESNLLDPLALLRSNTEFCN